MREFKKRNLIIICIGVYLLCLFLVIVTTGCGVKFIDVQDDVIKLSGCTIKIGDCVETKCGTLINDCEENACDVLGLSLCLIKNCADDVTKCVDDIKDIIEKEK